MGPSKRRKRADSRGATFGLGYPRAREISSPIHPLALGNHHGLGEPASIGLDLGITSVGGPSELSLDDHWKDGQVLCDPDIPLPGLVDHTTGYPEMATYTDQLYAPNNGILPEVNPSRGGIQGLHLGGNCLHQARQVLNRVEVHGNRLPISGSGGTSRPGRATKVSHNQPLS